MTIRTTTRKGTLVQRLAALEVVAVSASDKGALTIHLPDNGRDADQVGRHGAVVICRPSKTTARSGRR